MAVDLFDADYYGFAELNRVVGASKADFARSSVYALPRVLCETFDVVFFLGGAFLLHDVGMGLASYRGGTAAIEADSHFADLLASTIARLGRADPSASTQAIESAARDLLRRG